MLEVMPLQTKEERLSATEATGALFLEDTLAFAAFSNGNAIALCQFRITPHGGEICSLDAKSSTDSLNILSLLCNSVLSFIELCGEEYAYLLPSVNNKELIKSIGFETDNSGKLSLKLR